MLKRLNNFWFFLIIFILVLLFVFRSLFSNGFDQNLISWGDGPYIIWVINQNVGHFKNFDFSNIFQSNIFYPYKNTLLLSDLLLPQSIIYLGVSLLGLNKIANFNILLLLTFLLNYLALYLFWKNFFKNNLLSFLGSLFFIFSPFFIGQLGHFQMMSYWPMFFSLYFITKNRFDFKIKDILFAGLFLAVQFLASVYLAIFLCFVSTIWFLFNLKKENVKKILICFFIYFLTFLVLDGFFIKGYLEVKNDLNINRDLNEYILYSAHVTDYFFPSSVSSIGYKNNLIKKWGSFNYHIVGEKAFFPGFLFSILFLFGFLTFTKLKKKQLIAFELSREKLFFIVLIIVGFVFSLGPRLNVNGTYAHIPLPSYLFLKFFPMFNTIRASARWSFLVYLGMVYFVLLIFEKVKNKNFFKLITLLIIVWFLFEYIPIGLQSSKSEVNLNESIYLKENCKRDDVLIQVPYTHLFGVKGGIGNGLQYITKVELDSNSYSCSLVNGYTGYDIPEIIEYFQKLDQLINKKQYLGFYDLLRSRNVKYLKINLKYLEDSSTYEKFIEMMVKKDLLLEVEKNIYQVN